MPDEENAVPEEQSPEEPVVEEPPAEDVPEEPTEDDEPDEAAAEEVFEVRGPISQQDAQQEKMVAGAEALAESKQPQIQARLDR